MARRRTTRPPLTVRADDPSSRPRRVEADGDPFARVDAAEDASPPSAPAAAPGPSSPGASAESPGRSVAPDTGGEASVASPGRTEGAATSSPGPTARAEHLAALASSGSSTALRVAREPSPYDPASSEGRDRSFFRDVRAAAYGDTEARLRVDVFRRQLGEYLEAAQDQATSGDIIPPQWGGAWYVEELARLRPLVSSFSSASITDARPFPIPTFGSTTPAQLVAEHTEGSPAGQGTIDYNAVQVTPKAYSGAVDVTRELIDSSPLVDRTVAEALRESYSQVTEAAFAAVLLAGATAGPDGGSDAAAFEQAIRAALAGMPTTRFRTAGRILPSALQYGELAMADSTDGRPLMPYIGYGPTNAQGTAGAGFGTMAIAGVEVVPSWANDPATCFVRADPGDAMSFESSLLEFRYLEKQGPALVEYAVFGYFASVVRQALGVVKITSTAPPPAGQASESSGSGHNHRR